MFSSFQMNIMLAIKNLNMVLSVIEKVGKKVDIT